MIISKTPYRVSFFGGGTDYPEYYKEYGGSVLSTTIDKYCYICCKILPPFFEQKYRIAWSKIENVNYIDEIIHPSARECLKFFNFPFGLSITHDGELPARTGMGTSSSFTVGLLHALYALQGKMVDKKRLAEDAIYIERDMIKEVVGIQDQYAAAYGGLNRMYFNETGIQVKPVFIKKARKETFERSIMLFFTGISRTASEVASKQVKSIKHNISYLKQMTQMTDYGEELISIGNIEEFAKLLNEGWKLKRSLAENISNSYIDNIYETGIKAGALGGKLLGAGNGGFIMFVVSPEKQKAVREVFKDLIYIPVRFETAGSHISHYAIQDIEF